MPFPYDFAFDFALSTFTQARSYTLKYAVRVDGTLLNSPERITIRKRPNVPAEATMIFLNKNGKYSNYFGSKDIFEIKIGMDAIDSKPIFTGFATDIVGRTVLSVHLSDLMGVLNRDKIRLWEHFNFDGLEAGYAIRKLVEAVDSSMYYKPIDPTGIKGTFPKVILDETLRFKTMTSHLSVIKDILSRSWDTSEYPSTPIPYAMWMDDDRFHFRKMQRTADATPIKSYPSVDDLLESRPSKSLLPLINKVTVIGTTYKDLRTGETKNYIGEHSHASSIKTFGVHHAVYQDKSLTSNWQCENKAARIVMASKVKVTTSSISVPDFYTAIPNISVITVNDSAFGIAGNNLVSQVDIMYGGGNTKCTLTLNNVEPVMVKYI